VKMDLTGAQIKTVLEQQWQPSGASRPFLKLGVNKELTYTYDPAAPVGSHITEIMLSGVPLNMGATYSVGVNSFLASGGDNFFELAKGANKADSGQVDLEGMVDYFTAFPVVSPDLAQRAVGVRVSAPDADGYDVGDVVTVNLSSLEFTRGETAAGSVTVSLPNTTWSVAAPVTGGYTPTSDEVGTSTLQFPIPAGVTGLTRFSITVPTTGTVSSFAINVG
jgi:5'-nucleotidase